MKSYAYQYIALLHHLLLAHQLSSQNILVPRNVFAITSPSLSETHQRLYCQICPLLSQLLLLWNTLVERISKYVHDPLQLHTDLFQNQIALLSQKISPLPSSLPLLLKLFSCTLGTIQNDIELHKQHGLCFLKPCLIISRESPIEGDSLMCFSSPTKSRSIQTHLS